MIYKMTLKDSTDEMTFNLLEVPIVDKDIEGAVDNVTLDGNQYTDYLWLKKQFIQKWSLLCDDEYTRLKGFYTRQFENADVPSYRLYYGDDIIRNSTLSGEYVQFSVEGVTDGTISLTQIDGNTEQAGYAGKNLLNTNALNRTLPYASTSHGVTFTLADDGSITLSGKNDGTGNSVFTIYNSTTPLVLVGGSYTGGLNPTDGVYRAVSLIVYDGAHYRGFTQSSTQSLDASNAMAYLQVSNGETTQFSSYKIYPMLEAGTTKSPYEPYVGGVPAPNPSYPQPIETVTGRQTVTVAGKNLLRNAYQATQTINGVTITSNADGTITANGTATGTINFFINGSNTQYSISAGTYTLSTGTNDSDTTYFMIVDKSFSGEWSSRYTSTRTITVPSGGGTIAPRIVIRPNATLNNVVFKPMAELGNQATTFEPYKAQEYEINLGKNLVTLADGVETSNGITSTTNGSTISYSGTPSSTWAFMTREYSFSERLPVGTYTFSIGEASSTNGFLIALYDADRTQTTYTIPMGAESVTFTTTKESIAYRFALSGLTVGTAINSSVSNLQLEKGSTATAYAPYFEPIELCKIGTYQDRIYKDDGNWYIEKQIGKAVFDGSEAWSSANSNAYYYRTLSDAIILPSPATMPPVISDYYTPATRNDLWASRVDYGVGLYEGAIARVSIRNKDCANSDALKTWLASNPTTVYYALATPTTTEITNVEILKGLESLVDEAISVRQHDIYTDTPNALPTLTFDLTEYLSKSTTIIPETAVRLTLTDGGVINACGCRKDVQLTMRETIE